MKKITRILIILIAVFAITVLFHFFGLFTRAEFLFYDSRMRKTANKFSASDEIVLLLLDQNSLDYASEVRGWSWPWPREAYAEIVDFLSEGGANSIAFDMLFTEPSSYGKQDDTNFANSAEESGRVIQTIFFNEIQGRDSEWKASAPLPEKQIPNKININDSNYPGLFPIDELCSTASRLGNINGLHDGDGCIRRARLFYLWQDYKIPALGTASLLTAGEEIPEDLPRIINLRYRNSIDDYFPYSVGDILKANDDIKNNIEPELLPEDFSETYVFLGLYAPGLFDICQTPVSAVYPGVGVHITMLDNILSGDRLLEIPKLLSLIILLICIALAILPNFIFENLKSRKASVFLMSISFIAICFFYVLVSYLLFAKNIIIPVAPIIAAMLLAFISTVIVSYMVEGKQRRYLKSAFKQYLSPVVIDHLIANPDQLKLGGERKEISIFFSDLQGFTSISESLEPEELTELLNFYLSAMSEIILDSGGTIDKYEGDAIIAFWNAPIKIEDHAKIAIEAAYACQEKLAEMRSDLEEKAGGKPFRMRIGLNTGQAIVGNMGSVNRFDYTMLGDAVNLAARLEGLNKQFGSYTMCSQATKDLAEKGQTVLKFRELARAAVVGKNQAITVYEIMSEKIYSQKERILADFNKGLQEFYAGNFEKALAVFKTIENEDAPAQHYAEKCTEMIQNPPTEKWEGVWKATQK